MAAGPVRTGSRTRVLVVSGRPDPTRFAALDAALRPDADAVLLRCGEPLPPLDAYDAVVLDGPQEGLDTAAVTEIRSRVERGASLLAIGVAGARGPLHDLLGAHPASPALSPGEVFAKVADRGSVLVRRLDQEFAVADAFQPLEAQNGVMRPVVSVSVALRDRPAVLEGRLGDGRVVVCGLGNTESALATGALATMLRRAVRADGAAAERPLGVGIVGYGPYGGMGYAHGLAISAVDGLRLVAACDPVADRLDAARREFPGMRTTADAADLAAAPDIDVVIVATPPSHHAGIALDMLRAGKHVIVEKPLCLRLEEADELIAASRDASRLLTVAQNRRWDRDFLAVRQAVESGALGALFNMETFVGGFDHPCRAWHSDAAVSGGAVYDWGSHHVDWILQLMPEMPATVTMQTHKRVWHDVTNDDQLRLRLAWEDGREAQFLQSDVAAVRPPKFYLQGTAGTLAGWYRDVAFERVEPGRGYVRETAHHAEAPADLVLHRYVSGHGLEECRLPLAPEQRFAFHRNVADHLHLGEPLAVTPESVRRVIAVLEAATRSAARGGAPEPLSVG